MGFQACDYTIGLPLGPHEVVLLPGVEIAHRPPESSLETSAHQLRIIAFANVVLVGIEGGTRKNKANVV